MIRDLARKVARDRIAPNAAQYDETRAIRPSRCARWSTPASSVSGCRRRTGDRHGMLALSLVAEEHRLGRARGTTTNFGRPPARGPADPARRHREQCEYLPRLAAGEPHGGPTRSRSRLGLGAASLRTTGCARVTTTSSMDRSSGAPRRPCGRHHPSSRPSTRPGGPAGSPRFVIEKGMPGFSVGKKGERWGSVLAHRRAPLHGLLRARGPSGSARRARDSRSRCGPST